jgi:ABC-type multidrug transport system ATPase subunit
MSMVIEVEGLTKRYGAQLAVDDVGFTVSEGETFGILEVNGAGKTTTVECLQGLRRPDCSWWSATCPPPGPSRSTGASTSRTSR